MLEADATPGGLARTFGDQGFRSDIGGHILFSKDKEALAHEVAALGDNVHQRVRANKILYEGLHVKYPFENGIDALPKDQIVDILYSFIENPHRDKPTNFREWMYHVFGDGLTRRYLLPYNEKIWKTPPEDMSLEWVDRVPRPPLLDLVKTGGGDRHRGLHPPALLPVPGQGRLRGAPPGGRGGARAQAPHRLPGSVAAAGRRRLGRGERPRRRAALSPDRRHRPHRDALRGARRRARRGGRRRRGAPLQLAARGADRRQGHQSPRVHGALRAGPAVALSPRLLQPGLQPGPGAGGAPVGVVRDHGLAGERPRHAGPTSGSSIAWSTIWCATASSGARPSATARVHRERFAYVIYTHGYADRVRSAIREYTGARGIDLAGRFAEYQYVNTDACFRRAFELAREIRGGDIAPEARLPSGLETRSIRMPPLVSSIEAGSASPSAAPRTALWRRRRGRRGGLARGSAPSRRAAFADLPRRRRRMAAPEQRFDLVFVTEAAARGDLGATLARAVPRLEDGGHVVIHHGPHGAPDAALAALRARRASPPLCGVTAGRSPRPRWWSRAAPLRFARSRSRWG